MDPLADLLDGVRARSAAFCQAAFEPPWALRIADGAMLAFVTMLRGHAWIVFDDAAPVLVRSGDVAIVKGPHPYTVGDHPGTPPTITVHAGNRLTTMDGTDITATAPLSRRTGESGSPGTAVMASGTYQVTGDVGARLLTALPAVVLVPRSTVRSPVLDLLSAEVGRDEPGQQVVLDRLLDLALIETLRAWFARPDTEAPGWYRALSDPVVGAALRRMHGDPSRPWTVQELAAESGASRAAFARRFTALVGEPPMTYLTGWRLAQAADLLRGTDATVDTIARQVGYANAFALSVAFKRVRGSTPRRHRAGVRTPVHS